MRVLSANRKTLSKKACEKLHREQQERVRGQVHFQTNSPDKNE